MREDVLHRLASRLAIGDVDDVIESLRRSPELQGDLGWLDEILDAADVLSLPPVPADVSAKLHALWPEPGPARTERAALIHDSRSAGDLVGVRGVHRTSGWTALFTAATADIAVDGTPASDGATTLSGQVLSRATTAGTYDVVLTGPTEAISTHCDDVGQFELGSVPNGTYTLAASTPDHTIAATIDVGP